MRATSFPRLSALLSLLALAGAAFAAENDVQQEMTAAVEIPSRANAATAARASTLKSGPPATA